MTDANSTSRSLATLGANGWEILPPAPLNNDIAVFGDSHVGRLFYGTTISSATLQGNVVEITSTSHAAMLDNYVAVFGVGAEYDGLQKVTARVSGNVYQYTLARPPASGISLAGNATTVTQTRYMDRGWLQYANAVKGNPFNVRYGLGRSGAKTSDLLTHVHRDLSGIKPRLVVASFGQNDAIGGIADSVWQLNMRRLVDAILLYTDELWLTDVPPINAASGNYSVAIRDTCLRMCDYIEALAFRSRKIKIIPLRSWVGNPTSATNDYIANLTDDDQHLSGKAAQKVGVRLAALSGMWPAPSDKNMNSILSAKATDATSQQIFPFPLFQGSAATVGGGATGFMPTGMTGTLTNTSTTATLVYSVASRADGFGQNAHFVFTPGGNNDAADITITTASALASLVAAGDRIQFGASLSASGITGLRGIDLIMELFVGGVTYTISATNNSGTSGIGWADDFTDLPLISPEFIIPTGGVTAIQIRQKCTASGAGTITGDYSQLWIKILPPLP